MIKNKSGTVPFFLYNPTDGSPATGASSISIYVSLDGLTPVLSTNSAVEVSSSNSPGIYKVTLTAAEMNANVIVLTFSHAQYAAMPLTITTEEQFPTVSQIQSGLSTLTTADIPTANQIADTTLSRSVSNIESSASEHSLATMILGALESKCNSDNTWTIYRTDGQTIHVTKNITTDSTAKPITGVN